MMKFDLRVENSNGQYVCGPWRSVPMKTGVCMFVRKAHLRMKCVSIAVSLFDSLMHQALIRPGCKILGCIQKFPDWVNNDINNNKHSLRSSTKGYGCKTHYTDSQNSDTTAPSGRELYHLQFSLQAASPETFGYIHVCMLSQTFVFKK
jgi:hypothetical protein